MLVLTTYDGESDILRALDAGAAGYLLKDAPPEQLFAGIQAVAKGEPALAPSVAGVLMRRDSSREPRHPGNRRISREQENPRAILLFRT